MSADHQSAPEVILAAEVIDQTLRLATGLRSRLADALGRAGLNESRLTVLRIVAARGPHGCSQIELARGLSQVESSISTLVDRMKADRLLLRMRSKEDRRKSFLLLTDEGRSALETGEAEVRELAAAVRQLWGLQTLAPMRQILEVALFELERPQPSATRRAA